MGCFEGDSGGGSDYEAKDEFGNQAGMAVTGVPMQGTIARKLGLCGGKKNARKPAYYSNVLPFDPAGLDYSSPATNELDYLSPALREFDYQPK